MPVTAFFDSSHRVATPMARLDTVVRLTRSVTIAARAYGWASQMAA